MAIRTYFDFAENDFQYFMNSYKHGFVANAMAADAQEDGTKKSGTIEREQSKRKRELSSMKGEP